MMGDYSSLLLAKQADIDSAKRLSDNVNALAICHPLEVLFNSWIAVSLADGSYDGVLYDTRADAVRHQAHETQCAYLCLRAAPGGMQLQEAYVFLKFHRDAYDAGYVFTDPERSNGGVDMRMPIAIEDVRAQVRRMHARKYSRTQRG